MDISLSVYISRANIKYADFDYLISDLSYYAGMDNQKVAAIMSNTQDLHDKMKTNVVGIGSIVQPTDAYFEMRGLKTLAIRLDE